MTRSLQCCGRRSGVAPRKQSVLSLVEIGGCWSFAHGPVEFDVVVEHDFLGSFIKVLFPAGLAFWSIGVVEPANLVLRVKRASLECELAFGGSMRGRRFGRRFGGRFGRCVGLGSWSRSWSRCRWFGVIEDGVSDGDRHIEIAGNVVGPKLKVACHLR